MATLTATSEDTRVYEIAVLYPFPFTQKEEQTLLKEVEGIFAEAGGTQVAKDAWGRRGLAYKIGGYDEGNFVIYYYEFDPEKLKEMDQALRIVPGVLRHIIVKPPKGYQIVKFSEEYERWLNERETVHEKREREEEEKIRQRVADRAKRQVKKAEEMKKKEVVEKKKPMEEAELDEQLEKLISEDLEL